jgi:hypothetical protein
MATAEGIERLTRMLMYLTSWRERDGEARRFWKGSDFAVLDRLDDQGLIPASHRAKSASLARDGAARAMRLLGERGYPAG